jgi:ElaB/YqjD/DUF883 family membrane-anchored ribosome-binding protein
MAQNMNKDKETHGGTTNTTRSTTDTGTTRTPGTSSSSSTHGQSMTPSTSGGSSTTGAATGTGLAAQTQGYGQKIAGAATQAKDYVSDKVSVVGDKIKDLQNKDFNEVANQAKDYARQNPGQAILISAAAGLVLGLLIRSSRR